LTVESIDRWLVINILVNNAVERSFFLQQFFQSTIKQYSILTVNNPGLEPTAEGLNQCSQLVKSKTSHASQSTLVLVKSSQVD